MSRNTEEKGVADHLHEGGRVHGTLASVFRYRYLGLIEPKFMEMTEEL